MLLTQRSHDLFTVPHCCSALSLISVFLHVSVLSLKSPFSTFLSMILFVIRSTLSVSRVLTMPNFSKSTVPSGFISRSTLHVGSARLWQSTRQWKWSRMLVALDLSSTRLILTIVLGTSLHLSCAGTSCIAGKVIRVTLEFWGWEIGVHQFNCLCQQR